jgi:hypothetical protein
MGRFSTGRMWTFFRASVPRTHDYARMQIVVRPASLHTPRGLRSPSAAAERSPIENGSIVGQLGLPGVRFVGPLHVRRSLRTPLA